MFDILSSGDRIGGADFFTDQTIIAELLVNLHKIEEHCDGVLRAAGRTTAAFVAYIIVKFRH